MIPEMMQVELLFLSSVLTLQWNAENFSFYSNDNKQKAITQSQPARREVDAGGRLLDAIVVSFLRLVVDRS